VESSCEFGNEPLGSIKCWETTEWLQFLASRVVLGYTGLISLYHVHAGSYLQIIFDPLN
jgi:hypothetical protein